MALELIFNPLTGKLDFIDSATSNSFDTDVILTHEYNAAGSLLRTYDSISNTHIAAGPSIVIDNNGQIVRSD